MGLLDALRRLFMSQPASPAASGDPNGLWFYFRCNKCGDVVRVRAHRYNDLNREEGGPAPLVLRKDVMDTKCFQLMRAEIWLDNNYGVVSSEVSGGKLISEEEYVQAKAPKETW